MKALQGFNQFGQAFRMDHPFMEHFVSETQGMLEVIEGDNLFFLYLADFHFHQVGANVNHSRYFSALELRHKKPPFCSLNLTYSHAIRLFLGQWFG